MRIFHSFGDATVADAGLLGANILRNLGFWVLILRTFITSQTYCMVTRV